MKLLLRGVSDPTIWILLCFLVLFISKVIFKSNYFNITNIIVNHVDAFRNEKDNKFNKPQFVIAFIVPVFFAGAFAKIRIVDEDTINILTLIISVLTSMFFTLLAIVIDIKARWKENKGNKSSSEMSVIGRILQTVYYAVMFEILLSIILLILCFVAVFTAKFSFLQSILIYWFSNMLIMNLSMVLKRIFIVIDRTLK